MTNTLEAKKNAKPAPVPALAAAWATVTQTVVSYGSPSDAGDAARRAVRKYEAALERLAD